MKGFLRWVAFTLLCIVVGIASGLVLLNFTLSGGEVVVPDLEGKDILVALTVLNQREVNLRIVRREYSTAVPKNVIISQRPGAGTRIKKDSDVSVVISRGPKEVVVTFGSRGSVICSGGRLHRIPPVKTTGVVDATGCGDTYLAAYLHRRLKSEDVERAGRLASAAASLTLEQFGPFQATERDVEGALARAR